MVSKDGFVVRGLSRGDRDVYLLEDGRFGSVGVAIQNLQFQGELRVFPTKSEADKFIWDYNSSSNPDIGSLVSVRATPAVLKVFEPPVGSVAIGKGRQSRPSKQQR